MRGTCFLHHRLANTSICFWSSSTISWLISMRAVMLAMSSTRTRVFPAAPVIPEAAPSDRKSVV